VLSVAADKLIEAVCVSPLTPDWFAEVVKDIAGRYGLDCDVRKSQLADLPPPPPTPSRG